MLHLLIIAAGLVAQAFVRDRLVVPGDAAATASSIRSHAFLLRVGIAADLSTFVCAVALAACVGKLYRGFESHSLR